MHWVSGNWYWKQLQNNQFRHAKSMYTHIICTYVHTHTWTILKVETFSVTMQHSHSVHICHVRMYVRTPEECNQGYECTYVECMVHFANCQQCIGTNEWQDNPVQNWASHSLWILDTFSVRFSSFRSVPLVSLLTLVETYIHTYEHTYINNTYVCTHVRISMNSHIRTYIKRPIVYTKVHVHYMTKIIHIQTQ